LSDKKLLERRKQLKQKVRDYERAKERAEKLLVVRAENRNTNGRNGDGRERREYHREEREDEEERRRRPPPRRFQRPPPRDARPGRRGEEEERAREYDGPMDREEMMERRPNEWTRDKMRAKEKVEEKVFVPPPPKKLRTDEDGERGRGRGREEEEEEDGEVKEEGEAPPKKFVPPPGEMTIKAAPYVPPSRQKAKTWTRPAAPNRNRADGPKIPEIGSRGFTRQRSVSPGIQAKDLAPWTMSEPAKKPSEEEKEKPKNIPETIPEEKEIDVPLPPPRAPPISTKTEEEEEEEEKPSSPPKRKRTTRSKSPSPAPPPPPSRRSSRRSKSASVEPANTVADDAKSGNKKTETSKRTVKELKELLASKGLSTDGLKADLVKRVEENALS